MCGPGNFLFDACEQQETKDHCQTEHRLFNVDHRSFSGSLKNHIKFYTVQKKASHIICGSILIRGQSCEKRASSRKNK